MFGFLKRKKVEIKDIEYFCFSFSCSYFCDADMAYELCKNGDVFTAYIKPVGKPDSEKSEYAVDKAFALELESLLIRNGVGKWNGFDKANKNVLDGDNFSLRLTNGSGEKLYAHGYMKWPKNYSSVKNGIEDLFGDLDK